MDSTAMHYQLKAEVAVIRELFRPLQTMIDQQTAGRAGNEETRANQWVCGLDSAK
jgi:hypothetical protein